MPVFRDTLHECLLTDESITFENLKEKQERLNNNVYIYI